MRVQAPAISALFLPPLPGPGAPAPARASGPPPTVRWGAPRASSQYPQGGSQDLKGSLRALSGDNEPPRQSPAVCVCGGGQQCSARRSARCVSLCPPSSHKPFPSPPGDPPLSPWLSRSVRGDRRDSGRLARALKGLRPLYCSGGRAGELASGHARCRPATGALITMPRPQSPPSLPGRPGGGGAGWGGGGRRERSRMCPPVEV